MRKITSLILTILLTTPMLASISLPEKDALIKLYIATNGGQWKNKWDLNAPVSKWYGVKMYEDKVIALDLSNNNLVGELPVEIGNLIYVQKLKLTRNAISGKIPETIGNLKGLKIMNLSFNRLSGTIPISIGNISNLQMLELFMNKLSGTLPTEIGNLKDLKKLSLYNNEMH